MPANSTQHQMPATIYKKTYAIIVAGGSGTRMQSHLPKQFLMVNGKPLMMHTLDAFRNSRYSPEIIIVLPTEYHEYWKNLCVEYSYNTEHKIVNGGSTRFQSVKNGLVMVNDDCLVAVHDAVRPLIDTYIIDEAFESAEENGNAIVCVQSRDSIRQMANNGISRSLLRSEIYLVQTPQTFRSEMLKHAYSQPYMDRFTDDASVAELAGQTIHLIEGNHQNIKITFPEDITIAEILLQKTTIR